jgi:oligopeptide/dipeptide ABC transporter ATP-binding protein
VVEHISNRVAVMYLGKIAEIASAEDLYTSPRHPYTKALLSAIPIPDPSYKKNRVILQGDVPSPIQPPPGCHFHPRCPVVREECRTRAPELIAVKATASGADDHRAACLFPSEAPLQPVPSSAGSARA